ncbi:MAG: cupredoxin domain-containing protein [Actinobacteria bacterium]|nr:cupredoxin domain-containing protein [Actinomycetota bacterium]
MRRRLSFAVLLTVVLVGACNGDADDSADDTSTTTGPGVTVQATTTAVVATDFAFDPATVQVSAGSPVALRVSNKGNAPHTFTVDALAIDQEVDPGEEVEVLIQAPTAASHVFYCRFHRAQGMEGTLLVG